MPPDNDLLTALIGRLMTAKFFEDAAAAVLEAMLAAAQAALTGSASAPGAQVLRGMVHVRPDDGYQRLFGLEHPSHKPVDGTGYLTSANVWRWVAEHRCSVSIDVHTSTVRAWLPDGPLRARESSRGMEPPGQETRERLIGRDTTHVHVVPLRALSGAVNGMISLEVTCKAAIGQELPWGACDEHLQLCASVATPYVASLPLRPVMAAQTDQFLPVIGATMASLIELLRVFARQEETILISGPTGAGKSRLARWCHEHSRRQPRSYETLDLLSVPEDLQMAELFGWKRGAFTGAVKDNPGAIARSEHGTLFIDEIDKLSLKAQAGLLHVLEERRYRPLGEDAGERHANVRFLIGTNVDLRASVRAGRFREDLYYRIHVLPVRLPGLGERLDELPMWADYMLQRRHAEGGAGNARLAPEAVELLLGIAWPGNLRQLDNIIRRAYALALYGQSAPGGALVLERRHVEQALAYEITPDRREGLLTLLWQAASGFVTEAERRERGGSPLSLEASEAFRGMVLCAAIQRLGSRDKAFELLGQSQMIKNRNHHRALRRDLARVRQLVDTLGGEVEHGLAALLDDADDAASSG